jgi:MFS family permease
MRVLLYSMIALLMAIMLLVSGNAFLMTLLSARLTLNEVEPIRIGQVLFFYSLGFVVGTLYASRIIERVGHIRAFAVFSALLGMATLLYPVSDNLFFWALLRFMGGLTLAGAMIIVESWLSAVASASNRGTVFAIYQVCFYLAAALGQLFLVLGKPRGYLPFSYAAILLIAALIPLALSRMQAPTIELIERMPLRRVIQVSPEGFGVALMSGMLLGAFYSVAPVYALQIGLDLESVSWFMAFSISCAMVMAWPLGRVCDRFDRRRVMLVSILIVTLLAVFNALAGYRLFPLALLGGGLYLGFAAYLYAVAVAVTHDRMEQHQIVSASATLLMAYGIGSCLGPLVSTLAMQWAGHAGFYLSTLGFLILCAILLQLRIRWTRDIPVHEQEAFVISLPEGTQIINELDPRNEEFHDVPVAEIYPNLHLAESEPGGGADTT